MRQLFHQCTFNSIQLNPFTSEVDDTEVGYTL